MEIGQGNGIIKSSTLIFEYCLGWKGILIERSWVYHQMQIKNRPCSNKYWAAGTAVSHIDAIVQITINFYPQRVRMGDITSTFAMFLEQGHLFLAHLFQLFLTMQGPLLLIL